MTSEARLSKGEAKRRKVMGDDHVDRAMDNAHPFTLPLQQLITENCWGNIWTRPGLADHTRSLLNIAMLTALGHQQELAGHVRGAINNGCSAEEIREVIMQATVYAGAPAGLSAMRAAVVVLKEMGEI